MSWMGSIGLPSGARLLYQRPFVRNSNWFDRELRRAAMHERRWMHSKSGEQGLRRETKRIQTVSNQIHLLTLIFQDSLYSPRRAEVLLRRIPRFPSCTMSALAHTTSGMSVAQELASIRLILKYKRSGDLIGMAHTHLQ